MLNGSNAPLCRMFLRRAFYTVFLALIVSIVVLVRLLEQTEKMGPIISTWLTMSFLLTLQAWFVTDVNEI